MSYQRQFNLKYNPDVDRDVIEALERSGSPVDYVRRLVRKDIAFKGMLDDIGSEYVDVLKNRYCGGPTHAAATQN